MLMRESWGEGPMWFGVVVVARMSPWLKKKSISDEEVLQEELYRDVEKEEAMLAGSWSRTLLLRENCIEEESSLDCPHSLVQLRMRTCVGSGVDSEGIQLGATLGFCIRS